MKSDSQFLLKNHWFWKLLYLVVVSGGIYALTWFWAYDDPFITYRYAQNLAHGIGFVYNVGERVLSTTTPLFVLSLVPFAALGGDLQLFANLISAVSLGVGGLLLWDLSRSWQSSWVGWAGLSLYPTFGLLLNTIGSEIPFYLALCLATFSTYERRAYLFTALFCALAVLARPDGILIAVILATHFILTQRTRFSEARHSLLLSLIVFTVIILCWGTFALLYFGSPIPVTLATKQAQGEMAISQKFAPGFWSLLQSYQLWPYWLEAALAGLGLVNVLLKKPKWAFFLTWPVLYFSSYTLLGVSRYFWYYVPLIPGFVVLVGLGLEMVAGVGLMSMKRRLKSFLQMIVRQFHNLQFSTFSLSTFIAGLLLFVLFIMQFRGLWHMHVGFKQYYTIYRVAGEWVAKNIPQDASIGMLEIGIIGYYAQRPVVDFAGLIQPDVAQQMQDSTTYNDTALWAVENYQPQYLVLWRGVLPHFEREYVDTHCRAVHILSASDYSTSGELMIYDCQE